MPDVLDEIIDRLPPSTLKMILDFNSDSFKRFSELNNLIIELQNTRTSEITRELQRKTFDIKSKTAENRKSLTKLNKELEILKSLKEPIVNQQSIKAYHEKINELEIQIKNLTKDSGEVNLSCLFTDIENLNQEVEEYKKKIKETKDLSQLYDGFPPDIEQGKELIVKTKERIKSHESALESLINCGKH